MSEIEQLAKPIASPIIADAFSILEPFGQRVLASLLSLIAMRMEFLGVTRTILPQEYEWLRKRREPSQNWKIWIAQLADHEADSWARFYGAHLSPLPLDETGPERCNVQVATMVIGNLCAHTFYSPAIDIANYDYEGVHLTRIWPVQPFDIMTMGLPALSNNTVLWLHEAFARESPNAPSE